MNQELVYRLYALRREVASIEALVSREFSRRYSFVRVDAPSFHGVGAFIGVTPGDPTRIDVLLENGSVWSYPAECCTPVTVKDACRSLRLRVLRRRGVTCMGSVFRGPLGRLP